MSSEASASREAPVALGAQFARHRSSLAEECVVFECCGDQLPAIVHHAVSATGLGVVVVVGGPQYRAGSHRQFVLLARALAAAGFATLRFDYRGMGDADGEPRDFRQVGDDVRAAVDTLTRAAPDVSRVVLWGLCDGASAATYYASADPRVCGLVLLNPWVRSEAGVARAYLTRYYTRQLISRDFWRRLLFGQIGIRASLNSLLDHVRVAIRPRAQSELTGARRIDAANDLTPSSAPEGDLVERMADGLARFHGAVLFVTSGRDLTAQEFLTATRSHPRLTRAFARDAVCHRHVADADHTFSVAEHTAEVIAVTTRWLRSLGSEAS